MKKRRTEKVEVALKRLHQARDNGDMDGFNPATHVTDEGWVYRSDTQSYVLGLTYDFTLRTGQIFMPEDSCTDMTGVIQLFKAIDANVEAIHTHAGNKLNTLYRKQRDEWRAYVPAEDSP